MLKMFRKMMKTKICFRNALAMLPTEKLGQPTQGAFYEPNVVSLIQWLPWAKTKEIIQSRTEPETRIVSVRALSGLWAGKSPPKTKLGVTYETFLDYGRALKSATEYTLSNRIGFETDDDFETNCTYLRGKMSWIAGTEDGIPVICHRQWDDTYYLMNIDGANHFAAVYRQCVEQNRDFTFECRITHQIVNVVECKRIITNGTFLILSATIGEQLVHLLMNHGLELPPHFDEFQKGKSILVINSNLPKGQRLSEIVLETLDPSIYFDLGAYLLNLVSRR